MASCTDEELTPSYSESADAVQEKVPDTKGFDGEPTNNRAHQDTEFDHQLLPPADGGLVAWRFLFAAFTMEAFLWGWFHVTDTCAEADIHARLSTLVRCLPELLFRS